MSDEAVRVRWWRARRAAIRRRLALRLPFCIDPFWAANKEDWEWVRQRLLQDRGITEIDIVTRGRHDA